MKNPRTLALLLLGGSLVACSIEPVDSSDPPAADTPGESTVVDWARDGSPTFIVGELAKVEPLTGDLEQARTVLAAALPPLLQPFHLSVDELVARRISTDDQGEHHIRYQMTHEGLPVIGGDLVVHVDRKGAIVAINGTARGGLSATLGAHPISEARALAAIKGDKRFTGMAASATRTVFIQTQDETFHKALETTVVGQRGRDPVRDLVYIDVDTGAVVADYPQLHFAEARKVYSANHGTVLPGALMRSEGDAASADVDVNAAYDGTGDAWEAYHNFFNRDSYDNAGAQLISSVHYSTNYCNAYWDGTQMVYGDGDPSQNCAPLARAVDVTAHELTHAVTEMESGLVYAGESGGMNESTSDIFGAFVEAFTDGGKTGTLATSANTWLVGEAVLPPALRYMCDPATDGASADVWSSTVGNIDVHYSSGVGNLAFCLLAKGGTHPRGKTTMTVPAIGMDKAIRIFYKANVDILTSNSNYMSWRTATEQAAASLGYDDATRTAVSCAWEAVKVGALGACPGDSGTGTGGVTTLVNGVAVAGQAGTTGAQAIYKIVVPAGQTSLVFGISGGTGDADLYTQFGAQPTLTSYTCRPYVNGNAETCTITAPAAGTYYAMLDAYAAYSGVTIKATYTAGSGTGDPLLLNGVAVTGISGATGSAQYWRVTTPAAHTLHVTISGGTGDADLYVRSAARPTTTTYACRPYLTGNSETCNISGTVAGDYYVMLRGYAAFTGVTLKATY